MAIPLFVVDAFTDRPFAGNPAAVCLLEQPADEAWMRDVAREMNLSETAFASPRGDAFELRWFTPTTEVDLCGHATLATAHVLWELGRIDDARTVVFHTRSGALGARRLGSAIEMDFPADPPVEATLPEDVARALGAPATGAWKARIGYIVEVGSEAELRSLTPDLEPLAGYSDDGFAVTAEPSIDGADFVSRYFVPSAGIPEDPVTGAAHCALGPLWAGRLGRDEVVGYQASERGGWVHVTVAGERVKLRGDAVTVTRAELLA